MDNRRAIFGLQNSHNYLFMIVDLVLVSVFGPGFFLPPIFLGFLGLWTTRWISLASGFTTVATEPADVIPPIDSFINISLIFILVFML